MKVKGLQDTINWYDQNARKYAETVQGLASKEEIEHFRSLLFEGAKVLDLGCGSGRDAKLLFENRFEVEGVDLSEGLLKIARENNPNIKFTQANILDLPYEDGVFDGVWSFASLVHLESEEDAKKAVKEIHRVLKIGGIVHISVKAQTGEEKTAVVSDKLSGHDKFFQYYTKEEMKNMLGSGFEILKLEQYQEVDKNPEGRPEVEWIVIYAMKR